MMHYIRSERCSPERVPRLAPIEGPSPDPGRPTARSEIVELEQPAEVITSSSATYVIDWQSINGGGEDIQSTNYEVQSSIGQSVIGYSTSASYELGAGYWYGVSGGGGCACPFQADINGDGFIDSIDLSLVIDIVFFGGTDVTDPLCPTSRGDFNNDGFADSVDLSLVIDHVFFGGPGPTNPC